MPRPGDSGVVTRPPTHPPTRPSRARRPGRRRTLLLPLVAVLLLTSTAAAPAPASARTVTTAGAHAWPVPGFPQVGRPFDPPAQRYGSGHRGVDLVASPGTTVLAAGTGTVVFAGELAGRGVVSVQHADGLRTTYEPVTAVVRPGAEVVRGQLLGSLEAGHPGCPAAACLHWGVRRGAADYLDPLRLVGTWAVRLLPFGGTGAPGAGT